MRAIISGDQILLTIQPVGMKSLAGQNLMAEAAVVWEVGSLEIPVLQQHENIISLWQIFTSSSLHLFFVSGCGEGCPDQSPRPAM